MKPLLLSAADLAGGAARSAHRLHVGLRQAGIDSRMLVQYRASDDATILGPTGIREQVHARLARHLDRVPLAVRRKRPLSAWSTQWLANPVASRALALDVDLLHLHWVGAGFVPIALLRRFAGPVVWTMHDMWPLTGGCHYDDGCERYRERCGNCPILSSRRDTDLSRRVWRRKDRQWRDVDITVVSPSRWLADCARRSSLFGRRRVEVIPYGLPLDRYRPVAKAVARDILGLPQDRRLIAFGAIGGTSDRRKGYHLLVSALHRVAARCSVSSALVVFGASAQPHSQDFSFPSYFLGHLHDDVTLALVYSAADVFVAPSTQDNLPNTVIEASACGTPCVGFAVGGLPDLVEHRESGYLARPLEVEDLAHGVQLLLESPSLSAAWGARARARAVADHSLQRQAERYIALYGELLGSDLPEKGGA